METIFDELKQFIVKKIAPTDEIDIGKKYLICIHDIDKIYRLTLICGTDANFEFYKNVRCSIYEFEYSFETNKFIEIFLRIIANNNCDDLKLNDRKIILENDKYLFYKKYDANHESNYLGKYRAIFHKKAKLNGIDYFNDKYRIYFYV